MADLIKKIKIKKQDGTFTDYIPIGADAVNVETSDGESVELKLNKKPYYYNTVADMKADTKLKAGDAVQTLGYYEENDGGGAEYNITDTQPITGYYETLNNGKYAQLIVKDSTINVKQMGVKDDELLNQHDILQNIITKCTENNWNIFFDNGTYCFSGTLNFPLNQNGIKLIGAGKWKTIIKTLDDNSQIYFNDFLRTSITNIKFVSTGTENNSIIYIASTAHLSEIKNCVFNTNMGVDIHNSAYMKIEDCSFVLIPGHITKFLLRVNGEYFYCKNSYFEGLSSSSIGSNGVILNNGTLFYFDDCDFCNWSNGNAFKIDTSSASIKNITIENSTFVRNDISLLCQSDYGISNLLLNNNNFNLDGTNENSIITVQRTNGTNGVLWQLSGSNNIIDGSINDEVLRNKTMFTSSSIITGCDIEFMSRISTGIFPKYDNDFRLKIKEVFPNNLIIAPGSSTSQTITLLNVSPFKSFNIPDIVPLKFDGLQWDSYSVDNTYGGVLSITFNYSSTQAYTQCYLRV